MLKNLMLSYMIYDVKSPPPSFKRVILLFLKEPINCSIPTPLDCYNLGDCLIMIP